MKQLVKKKIKALISICIVSILMFGIPNIYANSSKLSNRYNVVIVLDNSGSIKDTDQSNYRFDAISQFVNLLADQGNRVGTVTFSTEIDGKTSITEINNTDKKKQIIDSVSNIVPNGYTNIGLGLNTAIQMLQEDGNKEIPSVILFISDGATVMASESETETSLDLKADAVEEARQNNIKIHTVCLNQNSSKSDTLEMQQIADATNGEYIEITNASDLSNAFDTFYKLIYGSSTYTIAESSYAADGKLEKSFEIPGFGVEEVNIVIYGDVDKVTLTNPNNKEVATESMSSKSNTIVKTSDVSSGEWHFVASGEPNTPVKVNLVINTNLEVIAKLKLPDGIKKDNLIFSPEDSLIFTARLKSNKEEANTDEQYNGYQAVLEILDNNKNVIQTENMNVKNGHFECATQLQDEGTFKWRIKVNYEDKIEKYSEGTFDLVIDKDAKTLRQMANHAPKAEKNPYKDTFYIIPFMDRTYSMDLSKLFSDKDKGDSLHYSIESSSFLNKDYTLSKKGVLTIHNFSLHKGSFKIRAKDKYGKYCDTTLVVKTRNVGVMTLIAILIGGLIALGVFLRGIYILLHKPTMGKITIQYNGQTVTRNGQIGRTKLIAFGINELDPWNKKSYFQGTGQRFVTLYIIPSVDGTTTVNIQDGEEIPIYINGRDNPPLYISFRSDLKQSFDDSYIKTKKVKGPKIKKRKIKPPKLHKR